jgi:hypothetical protein
MICASVMTVAAGSANAIQGQVDALGQGSARASIWAFPNQPPATANFSIDNPNSPFVALGPGLPGASPLTHATFDGRSGSLGNWGATCDIEAAQGDTVDWHSLLQSVTAAAPVATGTMTMFGTITGPNSATFTVTWSASDPGVAFHIGWFEGATELFETPVMIGPFSRTDTYTITSNGPIQEVMMESSGAAKSIPAPGGLLTLGAAGLLCVRRRR